MTIYNKVSQAVLWQSHIDDLHDLMVQADYAAAFEVLKLFFVNPHVTERLVEESCLILIRLIPHLSMEQQQDLLNAACHKLVAFPNLKESRIEILKCAGDFHALRDASVALRYYASVLALDPSAEIHLRISRLFAHLSTLHFPDLLDRAARRGVDSFESLLNTIPDRHRCFSAHPEEIKTYYAQAATVLTRISPEAHKLFGHLSTHVLSEGKKPVDLPAICPSQRHYQELARIRAIFSEPISSQEMQEKSFEHFTIFLKALFEEAIQILGEPPCLFDIRITGSCARKELCPFSDIEYFILIEDARSLPYFKQLAQHFEMQIVALGESDHGYVVPPYSTQFGLQIDPQSNPARDESLIYLPEAFIAKLAITTDDPEMLKALTSYLGSYSLFSNSLLGNIPIPEKTLQLMDQLDKEQKPLGSVIDLKRDLMAPLVYRLRNYALYHNICETNTLRLIDQLPFDELSKAVLKEAVSTLYKIRVRIHLAQGCTHETVSMIPSLELPVLSQLELEAIGLIYNLAIAPLSEVSVTDRDVDLVEIAFRNPSSSTVHFVVHFLARQGVPVTIHEKYYRMLLAPDQASLQQNYLDAIPRAIASELAQIPNRAGYRQQMRLDEERLAALLLDLTTDNATSGVKISSPLTGNRYLKQEVAQELLQNGHIKKAYAKSLHNVNHYGHLHFKELPYQPLMEYAIHSLVYRIMGKATPITTLARFEVDGVVYPVLISETIQGNEPQANADLDLRQLTGLRLCEILTKPGDGRLFNYIVAGQKIFCIDNDISFMAPVIKKLGGRKVTFCSTLFTFPHPLDPNTLRHFCSLEPDLILHDWLQELQAREETYLRLFSEIELKTLYDLDPERRFSPTILFPKGAIANLCLQFYHLQDVLRQHTFEDPFLLLRELISLDDTDKSQVGSLVERQYRKAMPAPFDKRLEKATATRKDRSMTSAHAMQINYKKIPTFVEIQSRGTYGLQEAKAELFLLEIRKIWNQVFIFKSGQEYAIEADFKDLKDLERQKLMLGALQYLYGAQNQKPRSLTIKNATALTFDVLQTLLHPDLEVLDLSYCPQIKDGFIQTAAAWIATRCLNLKELHLEGCQGISSFDASFSSLKFLNLGRCPNLTTVNCKIYPQELRLDHCPKLSSLYIPTKKESKKIDLTQTTLNIKSSLIGDAGVSALANALKTNSSITNIDLCDNKISDTGAFVLAEALKINSSITNFNLTSNKFGDAGAFALAEALKHNTSIRNITLWGNKISDAGASALAEALKVNAFIRYINLWGNKIGNAGASAFAEALKVNPSITHINLSYNEIGDAGTSAFAEALEVNSSIIHINLSHNAIGDEGASALAEALKTNSSIASIFLEGNQIHNAGASAFAEAIKANSSITYIILLSNNIGLRGDSAIAEALKANSSITMIYLESGTTAFAETLKVNSSITSIYLENDNNSISDNLRQQIKASLKRNKDLRDRAFDLARSGNLEILESLNSGVSLYSSDKMNNSLLHTAAQNGHAHLVEALLQRSKNPTFITWENKENKNASDLARENGHESVVEILSRVR